MPKRLVLMVPMLLVAMVSLDDRGEGLARRGMITIGLTELPFSFDKGTFGRWSGGVLIAVQDRFSNGPGIRVIERDGRETARFTLELPGASHYKLYDNTSVARGPDGTLAVTGHLCDDAGPTSFLAILSPEGQTKSVARLKRFSPQSMTVAADGAIWVVGYEITDHPDDRDYSQHLIRRYSAEGKLVDSFIPWSTVRTPPRTHIAPMRSILASASDRVGWYAPSIQTYVEFSLNGSVINWTKTPEHSTSEMISVGLCDDAGLFVSVARNAGQPTRPSSWRIFALDRQGRTWVLLAQQEKLGWFYGCDGARVASATDPRFITWLEHANKTAVSGQ